MAGGTCLLYTSTGCAVFIKIAFHIPFFQIGNNSVTCFCKCLLSVIHILLHFKRCPNSVPVRQQFLIFSLKPQNPIVNSLSVLSQHLTHPRHYNYRFTISEKEENVLNCQIILKIISKIYIIACNCLLKM